MDKKNARLVFWALIAFTAITWLGTIKNQSESTAAYEEFIEKAKVFEERGIYVDALENYKSALALDSDNYDIAIKVADMYYLLGDIQGFVASCNTAISLNQKSSVAYERLVDYYLSKFLYSEAISTLKDAKKYIKDNEKLNALQEELSTKCIEKYVSFSQVGDWHVQEKLNYIAVENNGKWGMTLKDGSRKISFLYEYIGAYDDETGVIPCCYEGVYYYLDVQGYKKYISDVEYQFLGSFGSGLAPALRNGKYGYIDTDFNEQNFEFDYAGAFANNIAAVKKDGKWALINDKMENITSFEYDEILMDENGFCSTYDIIIVRKNEKYFFVNHSGNQIGTSGFDCATMPASNDGHIAIRLGDMWGFANGQGDIVIEPKYESAKSFSMGMAPIKLEDRWGYINMDEKVVIDMKYLDAGVFSSDGAAPVKNGSVWNFIVLCEYDD